MEVMIRVVVAGTPDGCAQENGGRVGGAVVSEQASPSRQYEFYKRFLLAALRRLVGSTAERVSFCFGMWDGVRSVFNAASLGFVYTSCSSSC